MDVTAPPMAAASLYIVRRRCFMLLACGVPSNVKSLFARGLRTTLGHGLPRNHVRLACA
jgi:hypothetical protein